MSIMRKLLEINDELVKVRQERDELTESYRLARKQIEELVEELMEARRREWCLTNELNVVKDNLSHHLKLVQQQQLAVTIGTYWTPSLDDLRLKRD